jgi:hypothetical protein
VHRENYSFNCGVDIFHECVCAGSSAEGWEQVARSGEAAESSGWVQTSRNSQRNEIVGGELCGKRKAEYSGANRFRTSSRREVEKKNPCLSQGRGYPFEASNLDCGHGIAAPMSGLSRRFKQLDEELLALGEETMLLEELDGFIAGLLVCPDLIKPGEWLPIIWNRDSADQQLAFDNLDHVNRVLGLVVEHYNSVARTLMERPDLRHLPELGPETNILLTVQRGIIFVACLFALFCTSLEVERLGQAFERRKP